MHRDQEPPGPWGSATASGESAPVGGEPAVSWGDETKGYEHQLNELDTRLAEVERALRRLDEGTYGTCEVCGRPTEPETDEAPSAGLRCFEHR